MQKNQDPNDEEASTDDDLLSNEEDQTILELITKKKEENKSLRQVTGSVKRYGIADNRSSLGESKLFSNDQTAVFNQGGHHWAEEVNVHRPPVGLGTVRRKLNGTRNAVSSDVSRLDGKPVPTGRRVVSSGKPQGEH